MNLKEYEKRLRDLTADEYDRFCSAFGGGQQSIEERLRSFVDHPEHERRICQLLDLNTEAEKMTSSTVASAKAAEESARSARLSMVWSGVATIVAMAALLISMLKYVSS